MHRPRRERVARSSGRGHDVLNVRPQSVLGEGPGQDRGDLSGGVDHEDLCGMIDRVAAVGLRRRQRHRDPELAGKRLDGRLVGGGYAEEFGVEIRHVLGELGRCIALGVHRHEHHLRAYGGAALPQALLQGRQCGEGRRAEIRAIGVAEEQERPAPAQARGAKGLASLVDQAKIRHRATRRQVGARREIERRRGVPPQERRAQPQKDGDEHHGETCESGLRNHAPIIPYGTRDGGCRHRALRASHAPGARAFRSRHRQCA